MGLVGLGFRGLGSWISGSWVSNLESLIAGGKPRFLGHFWVIFGILYGPILVIGSALLY